MSEDLEDYLADLKKWGDKLEGSYDWSRLVPDDEYPPKPPTIVENSYKVGNSADFYAVDVSCDITCFPEPTLIEWYKGDVKIAETNNKFTQRRFTLKKEFNYRVVLRINYPVDRDAGIYKCKIVNCAGSADCEFLVSLWEGFDGVKVTAPARIDYIGENCCEMHASISGVNNATSISWHRQRTSGRMVRLPETDKFAFSAEYDPLSEEKPTRVSCVVKNFNRLDSGIYCCKIEDELGKKFTFVFPLMYDPRSRSNRPKIFSNPRIFYMQDCSVVMMFWIRSKQRPSFRWQTPDGKIVEQNEPLGKKVRVNERVLSNKPNKLTIYESRLQINDFSTATLGRYRCMVRNCYGTVIVPFDLNVDPRLRI